MHEEFSKPQLFNANILNLCRLTKSVLKIDFSLINPSEISFLPGQFISIQVSDSTFRSYSICSNEDEKTKISIAVSVYHSGIGADFLKNLKIKDKVNFIGPSGRFALSDNLTDNILFVATGTGISPFISMLYKLAKINFKSRIRLLFGYRSESDLFFIAELDVFKTKFIDFDYEIWLSQSEPSWNGFTGRVTDQISNYINTNTQVYLCGNPNMIEDSMKILLEMNISKDNIYYEKYKRAIQ